MKKSIGVNKRDNVKEFEQADSTTVSVDCVVFGYDGYGLKVLIMDCTMPHFKGYDSLIGELVLKSETLDEAAKRILQYWTGLDNLYLEQVKAFSDPGRHPLGRVISVAYYSLVQIDNYKIDPQLKDRLRWADVNELGQMAFDHYDILHSCLSTLQKKIREKPLGFSLLPKKFTLIQLQNLYESILSIELDKRNFRRKLTNLGLLIDLDELQQSVNHRPAKLYSFDFEKYRKKKSKGNLQFEI